MVHTEDSARDAYMRLGRRLAARRREAGYPTQSALATALAYGRSTVANAESGRGSVAGRLFWQRCDDVLRPAEPFTAEYEAIRRQHSRVQHASPGGESDPGWAPDPGWEPGAGGKPGPGWEPGPGCKPGPGWEGNGSRGGHAAALDTWENAVDAAAGESTRQVALVAGRIDPYAIEQLTAATRRLAHAYPDLPPMTLLAQARGLRDEIVALLPRTHHLSQRQVLYRAAGHLCGLLSLASRDVGRWDAAQAQARTAARWAEQSDDGVLHGWSCGTRALLSCWTGLPRQAAGLADEGLRHTVPGPGQARLWILAARAWALLGDETRATAALDAAARAHETRGGESSAGPGGEFAWTRIRHEAGAARALLYLRRSAAAATRLRGALTVGGADAAGNRGMLPRIRADLALAELGLGDLDAAAAALEPLWGLPPYQRRQGLTARLGHLVEVLARPPWRQAGGAADLRERAERFTRVSAATTVA